MNKRLTASLVFAIAAFGGAVAQGGDIQTKQYEDGGIYEGTFKNGLQHGSGTYTLPNGYEYSGEWRDGDRKSVV